MPANSRWALIRAFKGYTKLYKPYNRIHDIKGVCCGNLRGKGPLGRSDVNGWVVSSISRTARHELDWSGSGYGQVAAACGSIKFGGTFLISWGNVSFSRKTLLHGVKSISYALGITLGNDVRRKRRTDFSASSVFFLDCSLRLVAFLMPFISSLTPHYSQYVIPMNAHAVSRQAVWRS